jgi:hypothetical protein
LGSVLSEYITKQILLLTLKNSYNTGPKIENSYFLRPSNEDLCEGADPAGITGKGD